MHAGGVLADALLPKQTLAGILAVFGAKVRIASFVQLLRPSRICPI